MRYDRPTGVWYRRSDRLILDEGVYDNVPVARGDVVLDLGAHIGTATRLFLRKGAARSVAVEPDPENLAILRRNVVRLPVTIVPAAVGATNGQTAFYTRADRGFVGSILADPTRKRFTVPVVALSDLLAKHRPTIVKCDIEFAEYGLPELRALPDHVRVLTGEVHIRYVGIFGAGRTMDATELRQRREAAADLVQAIEAQGFREHWRKDKQVTEKQAAGGHLPADPDDSGLGAMTKCICATWVRE